MPIEALVEDLQMRITDYRQTGDTIPLVEISRSLDSMDPKQSEDRGVLPLRALIDLYRDGYRLTVAAP
jgi:hypothetical protein